MIVVKVERPVKYRLDDNPVSLEAGKSYVFTNEAFANIQRLAERNSFGPPETLGNRYRQYAGNDLTGKSLFLWRSGGIGDLLFMTPSIKYIKTKWPDCRIILATQSKYFSLFQHHPHFDELVGLPFSTEMLHDNDYHLHFHGIIEENQVAERVNAYDLFVQKFGLRGKIPPKPPEMLPFLPVWGECAERASREISVMDPLRSIRVGLHVATSSPIRNWPVDQQREFCRQATNIGYKVFLFGSKANMQIANSMNNIKGVYNLIPNCERNLEMSVAFTNLMDIMVGPDSAMLHIAGALGVPMVGLYGPFNPDLRLKYYRNASSITGLVRCQPRLHSYHCFLHGDEACAFADQAGESYCMKLIDHQSDYNNPHDSNVLTEVKYVLEKTGKRE